MSEKDEAVCPFCKEKVRPEARKCPHCLMPIPPNPQHDGTCPICKETIDPQATRCPHCKSWVSGSQTIPPELPRPLYRVRRRSVPIALPPASLDRIVPDTIIVDGDVYWVEHEPSQPPPEVFCRNVTIYDGPMVVIERRCYNRETGKLVSRKVVGRYSLLDDTAR